ncbi:hypothetical protein ACFLT2_03480 [Acidobacteriota bacterium]
MSSNVVSNLGLMVNLSEKYALGVTTYVSYNEEVCLGLKARGRRWLSSKNSLNLGVGLMLWNSDNIHSHIGFTSDVSLSFHDLLIAEVVMEITSFNSHRGYDIPRYSGTDIAILIGLKTGSTSGLFANTLSVVAGTMLGAVYAFGDGD